MSEHKSDVKDLKSQTEIFLTSLQRRHMIGSYRVSRQTLILLRNIISTGKWKNAHDLMENIRLFGRQIDAAAPSQVAAKNMVRRVLHIIHSEVASAHVPNSTTAAEVEAGQESVSSAEEESTSFCDDFEADTKSPESSINSSEKNTKCAKICKQKESCVDQDENLTDPNQLQSTCSDLDYFTSSPCRTTTLNHSASLQTILLRSNSNVSSILQDQYNISAGRIKTGIIEDINELISELESSRHNISIQAQEHIHSNEIIMTLGGSGTVEVFLKAAHRKRQFKVVIVEGAPSFCGRDLAVSLSSCGIDCTLIPDAAASAMMSRVNKVMIGTHAVMADGGLMAMSGSRSLALCAYHRSVPVIVLAQIFKLCPEYICSYDQDNFQNLENPQHVFSFEDADIVGRVQVSNPGFDYVEPEYLDLFITNVGGHSPSYVYRLLSEIYTLDETV